MMMKTRCEKEKRSGINSKHIRPNDECFKIIKGGVNKGWESFMIHSS